MISIINVFDLITDQTNFSKLFFCIRNPLPHLLMVFSAVQSTSLQLLLDANTCAASTLLCSLWRAELPAWRLTSGIVVNTELI